MAEQHAIEDKINSVLSGDALKNALDFVAFLRANGLSPECHDSGDGWSIMRAGESPGFILVNGEPQMPGPWTVWFNSCDFDGRGPVDDDLKETAWAHASICGNFSSGGKDCGCGDQPGFRRTIFGKVFENRCHSPLMFTDPDAETLENMKKLMLMLK
ncbi:MAG: hypothetical protein FWF44_12155 [Defluviitaleaceae bacterium]|nr:hypothetical protein [Defluviitaleaceae bacterium]